MSKKSRQSASATLSEQSARSRGKKKDSSGQSSTQQADAAPTSSVVPTTEASAVNPDAGENILPVGQNIALPSDNSGVSSSSQTGSGHSFPQERKMATFKFRKTDKSGSSSYAMEGVKSSVYFNKGIFAGEPPATVEISLPEGVSFTAPGAAKTVGVAALTPEQRKANAEALKAKRAAMTPAEKAAERLEKARAALAAAEKAAQQSASA